MTEILEKCLMIGFGVAILILFLSISAPFFELLETIKEEGALQKKMMCISIINSGINKTIENPSLNFSTPIEIPENFSIITSGMEIKYSFELDNSWYEYIFKFSQCFFEINFKKPGYHILTIYIKSDLVYINFV